VNNKIYKRVMLDNASALCDNMATIKRTVRDKPVDLSATYF